jgi:hypothetical protein
MFSGLFFPQTLGESNKLGNFTVQQLGNNRHNSI